jgi:hypothetical protein
VKVRVLLRESWAGGHLRVEDNCDGIVRNGTFHTLFRGLLDIGLLGRFELR